MDNAIEYCEQACDERDGALLAYCRYHPNLRRLRADPRFGNIVKRLGLAPFPTALER